MIHEIFPRIRGAGLRQRETKVRRPRRAATRGKGNQCNQCKTFHILSLHSSRSNAAFSVFQNFAARCLIKLQSCPLSSFGSVSIQSGPFTSIPVGVFVVDTQNSTPPLRTQQDLTTLIAFSPPASCRDCSTLRLERARHFSSGRYGALVELLKDLKEVFRDFSSSVTTRCTGPLRVLAVKSGICSLSTPASIMASLTIARRRSALALKRPSRALN